MKTQLLKITDVLGLKSTPDGGFQFTAQVRELPDAIRKKRGKGHIIVTTEKLE